MEYKVPYEVPLLDACLQGQATLSCADDYIEHWHRHNTSCGLNEALGLSPYAYSLFLRYGDLVLKEALTCRRMKADFDSVWSAERAPELLNSVYTRSGQNSTPNSNATNLHSSQKRCCSFCISSSNASPTFQVQKSIFHQMTKPIQVTVILPLLLAISFSRNDDIHSSISGISNDLIGVIPTIGQ